MTFIVIAVSVAAYAMLSGVFGQLIVADRKRCRRDKRTRGGDDCYDSEAALFQGVVWPIVVPVILGSMVGDYLTSRDDRRERKARKVKLEHDRKMAQLDAERRTHEAALRVLDAEGWKARVQS